MSVLVKGMEMPKNCCCCNIADSKIDSAPREGSWSVIRNCKGKVVWDGYYGTGDAVCQERRPDDCPLVEVPPHGRLIDADALKCVTIETLEALKKNPKMDRQEMHLIAAFGTLGAMIDDAQTIIPADNDSAMEVKQNG